MKMECKLCGYDEFKSTPWDGDSEPWIQEVLDHLYAEADGAHIELAHRYEHGSSDDLLEYLIIHFEEGDDLFLKDGSESKRRFKVLKKHGNIKKKGDIDFGVWRFRLK